MGRALVKAAVEEGRGRKGPRDSTEETPASTLGDLGALELLSGARTWQDLDIKRATLSLRSV